MYEMGNILGNAEGLRLLAITAVCVWPSTCGHNQPCLQSKCCARNSVGPQGYTGSYTSQPGVFSSTGNVVACSLSAQVLFTSVAEISASAKHPARRCEQAHRQAVHTAIKPPTGRRHTDSTQVLQQLLRRLRNRRGAAPERVPRARLSAPSTRNPGSRQGRCVHCSAACSGARTATSGL